MRESLRQVQFLEYWIEHRRPEMEVYGDHWGRIEDSPLHQEVLHEWLLPEVHCHSRVMEIGCGGGRWSRHYTHLAAHTTLVEGTPAAEAEVRSVLKGGLVDFVVSEDGSLHDVETKSVDYVFSFDTFVHFEPELFNRYLLEISRVTREGGKLHLHYASEEDAEERNYDCFKYRSHRGIKTMLSRLGFRMEKRMVQIKGYGSRLVSAVKIM